MCLILFSWNAHPQNKLILLANRDEFYKRPTTPAHFWEGSQGIFAGKDEQAGGTWLGINKAGKFAAITNYRNLYRQNIGTNFISRGELVADFLNNGLSPLEYLNLINQKPELYDGFNLLTGNYHELYYYSNIEREIKKLEAGIYGLSNNLLNSPWPKVVKGKNLLENALKQDTLVDSDLLTLLYNLDQEEKHLLPDTGVGLEMEKALSSMFINLSDYGTRSSTILRIGNDGSYYFVERTYEPNGKFSGEVSKTINMTI